jgi:Ca-activated chloride channel family protein
VLVTGRMARGWLDAPANAERKPAGDVVPAAHATQAAEDGSAAPTLLLVGTLEDRPYSLEKPVQWARGEAGENPLVPRLWANAKISELARSSDADAEKEAIQLAKEYHVMSRGTALLVLESERMFAEFGIRRTARGAEDKSGDPFSAAAPPGASAKEPSLSKAEEKPADSNAPTAPWGKADGFGKDALSAKGNMWGDDDSSGVGKLGLTGIGEGGGGRGEGIGLGSIGTIGRGAATGTGQGFGSGHGRLGGSHRSKPPQVRMGATNVSGRLPPEVIQRIVRQNFGRFRLCYENGLRNNPNLQGRVAVRFVIGRDGAVSNVGNGGSDMPDGAVVSCVVRAFSGLTFPVPEGGIVTVTYPIMFSPGGGSAPATAVTPSSQPPAVAPPPPLSGPAGPTAFHRAPAAASAGSDAPLAKLRAAADEAGASRQKHEALVRRLLISGRADEALAAAARFAELDPDLDAARELLAFAAAANGQAEIALSAVDALSETSARNASRHARAARAFEAAGDERRACAHWRALADLSPRDDGALHEALRCRARVLGEREAALEEARAVEGRGPRVAKLIATLEAGVPPAFDPTAASDGQFVAKVVCAAERSSCPSVAIVTPGGAVMSPWTPGTARAEVRAVAFSRLSNGTYRVIATGGTPGIGAEVELLAFGVKKRFPIDRGGAYTVAMTTVSGIE